MRPIHTLLVQLREAEGLTQDDAAGLIGVDKTAVSHWETGDAKPDLARLPAIAKALKTTHKRLLDAYLASLEMAA